MRQKTKNHQNQGSIDKKLIFFRYLSDIPRWVHFVQNMRAKNSHAWAMGTFKSGQTVHLNSRFKADEMPWTQMRLYVDTVNRFPVKVKDDIQWSRLHSDLLLYA
jgi:hypothetical protein